MFPVKRASSLLALAVAGLSVTIYAQTAFAQTVNPTASPTAPQKPADAGETSSPHHIQLDSQHRVITAGGFVKSGPVIFRGHLRKGRSDRSGPTRWARRQGLHHRDQGIRRRLLDYDNDGWLDIYIVNGSTFDALSGKDAPPHAALFHNNHDGTFTDVSAKAGVTNDRWGFGWPWLTTTTTAGPISMSPTSGKIACTTTTMTARSPMSPRKPALPSATGLPAPPGATTTGTDARSLCCRVPALGLEQSSSEGRRRRVEQLLLHVSRGADSVRPARPEGRAGSPLSQQRRRNFYRRERKSRRGGQARLLRSGRSVRRY